MKRYWIIFAVLFGFLWTANLWAESSKAEWPECKFGEILEASDFKKYRIRLNKPIIVRDASYPTADSDLLCFQKLMLSIQILPAKYFFDEGDIVLCSWRGHDWLVEDPRDAKSSARSYDRFHIFDEDFDRTKVWVVCTGEFEWCFLRASVDALTYLLKQPGEDFLARENIRLFKMVIMSLRDCHSKRRNCTSDEVGGRYLNQNMVSTFLYPDRVTQSPRHKAIESFSLCTRLLNSSEFSKTFSNRVELHATARRLKEAIGRYMERMATEEKVLETMLQELRKQEALNPLMPRGGDLK